MPAKPTKKKVDKNAKEIAKIKRQLKEDTEVKYIHKTYNDVVDWDGTMTIVNNPIQGVGNNQRVGNSIRNLNLKIKGQINFDQTSTTTNYSPVRMIIIRDHNNDIATTGDFLFFSGNQYAPNEHYSFADKSRYTLLYDKRWIINENHVTQNIDFTVKVNSVSLFTGATSTIRSNAIKVFLISNRDTADYEPQFIWLSELTYTDS